MTEVATAHENHITGQQGPSFSGKEEDFEDWVRLVRKWKNVVSIKDEKLADKLILSQLNDTVKKVYVGA